MQINIGTVEQVTTVELEGDIDASTAPSVQEKVLLLTTPGARILLNMVGVPYMSSAGLRMLLSLYRQSSSNESKLVLVGLSEEIKDTMSITGFLEFFITCETVEAGLEALKS